MLHEECRDRDAVFLIDPSLPDIICDCPDALCGKFFIHVAANMNVKLECLRQVAHHVTGTVGPPYFEWHLRSGAADQGVSIRSGMSMTWSECRCVRNNFVTALIGYPACTKRCIKPRPASKRNRSPPASTSVLIPAMPL